VSGELPWQSAPDIAIPYIRFALGHLMIGGHFVEHPRRQPRLPSNPIQLSNLWQTFYNYPDDAFVRDMRLSRPLANYICDKLVGAGYFHDNMCRNRKFRTPASYKVFSAIYYMAHGGEMNVHAKAAHVSVPTMSNWVHNFAKGVIQVFADTYMRPPDSQEEISIIQKGFESRRGMSNVGLAIDGTHIPWRVADGLPREDFHNYKGWYSTLAVAFVDSTYRFQGASVGWAGRCADTTCTSMSGFFNALKQDPARFLGKYGCAVADGAWGVGEPFVLSPYVTPMTVEEAWFNFCHSSTRFFVEQAFGMWKNRFRFLLLASGFTWAHHNALVYASMVLHNMCISFKEVSGLF
jgi:hypothetical protein